MNLEVHANDLHTSLFSFLPYNHLSLLNYIKSTENLGDGFLWVSYKKYLRIFILLLIIK